MAAGGSRRCRCRCWLVLVSASSSPPAGTGAGVGQLSSPSDDAGVVAASPVVDAEGCPRFVSGAVCVVVVCTYLIAPMTSSMAGRRDWLMACACAGGWDADGWEMGTGIETAGDGVDVEDHWRALRWLGMVLKWLGDGWDDAGIETADIERSQCETTLVLKAGDSDGVATAGDVEMEATGIGIETVGVGGVSCWYNNSLPCLDKVSANLVIRRSRNRHSRDIYHSLVIRWWWAERGVTIPGVATVTATTILHPRIRTSWRRYDRRDRILVQWVG